MSNGTNDRLASARNLRNGEGYRTLVFSLEDYTAPGEATRSNGFAPDGRHFAALPETVVTVTGEPANAPPRELQRLARAQSNTFVEAAFDSVSELTASLPPTTIGQLSPTTADIRQPAFKFPGLGRFGSRPACTLRESPNVLGAVG